MKTMKTAAYVAPTATAFELCVENDYLNPTSGNLIEPAYEDEEFDM